MPRERTHREALVAEPTPAQKMGKRLRDARLRLNMTQSEVASDRFSVSYISAVERGQIRPSLGALELLSARLEVPLADLVSDERGGETTIAGSRESAAERRQEDAEAKLRTAQALMHQHKHQDALDTLRQINIGHLTGQVAADVRRMLAHCYIELDLPEDARREALEGIALAERTSDEEMRARLRNELGGAYQLGRKPQLALEQYRLAHDAVLLGVARDPAFKLNTLYNLGATYWMLNQPDDAIGYLREAVELSNELNQPERLGDALFALSLAFGAEGDSRQAKLYAVRAIASYEQADNHRLAARAYTRLGRATAQTEQVEEALMLLHVAEGMTERERDIQGQAEVQRSLAAVLVSQKRLAEAKAAAQKALELAQTVKNDILLAESQMAMAQVQDAQGQSKQAEASYEQAIALLEKTGARQHLGDAYATFSSFLEARGQSQRALEVLKQAWNIREGVNA